MSADILSGIFPSENNWPFLGRAAEVLQCLSFLKPDDENALSRRLSIVGESGSGKSFFVKELICKFTQKTPDALALYVNIDQCEFESIEFEKRLSVLASFPAQPTRSDPQHVPINTEIATYKKPLPAWERAFRYTVRATKEAIKAVPIAGKPVSAFLPSEISTSKRREMVLSGRFWDYLIETARGTPVMIVIDNFQFLPHSVAMDLDSTLSVADIGIRLVTVERTKKGVSEAWNLRCFGDARLEIGMTPLSVSETQDLVHLILKDVEIDLPRINETIFRKSQGNPKQIWLQLRSFLLGQNLATPNIYEGQKRLLRHVETTPGPNEPETYDELIRNLPELDQLALQLITLLMGGLKVDDVVAILCQIVNPYSEQQVREVITDLAVVGLLIINGTSNDRIRIEHELVAFSVRRSISEEQALELRASAISAIGSRLETGVGDDDYERLVDRLVGLSSPSEIRRSPDLLSHIISLLDRQYRKENFRYLTWLFATESCQGILDLLPTHCIEVFLDAFQKTSAFDRGLAAVEVVRSIGKVDTKKLSLYAAKYLVQKFDYEEAVELLDAAERGSERQLVLHNVLLNLCREDEAREIVATIPEDVGHLNEYQCVMLRNSAHLYDAPTAKILLARALDGFASLGQEFGVATALNNLGVLELWEQRLDLASDSFSKSIVKFRSLDSNEIYQPLSNLAVLKALCREFHKAEDFLSQAQATLPSSLRMDKLMVGFNEIVISLMSRKRGLGDIYNDLVEIHKRSAQIKDLRFKEIVAWFLRQVDEHLNGRSEIKVSTSFEQRILNSARSGIEVFFDFEPFISHPLTGVLVLSPHWRY